MAAAPLRLETRRPLLRPYFRRALWSRPLLYWPIAMVRQRKNILSRNFDLMVDGFPRSGNTFAANWFQLHSGANRISSHHHNPAAVTLAVQRSKPVLILIRNPAGAAASWAVRSRYPIAYILDSYIDYYRLIAPLAADICICGFHELISSPEAVTARLNCRFGLNFAAVSLSAERRQQVFSRIEDDHLVGNAVIDEHAISRPSGLRAEAIKLALDLVHAPEHSDRLNRATHLYESFLRAAAEADAALPEALRQRTGT